MGTVGRGGLGVEGFGGSGGRAASKSGPNGPLDFLYAIFFKSRGLQVSISECASISCRLPACNDQHKFCV